MENLKFIGRSILAGVCISIGGIVYLKVGGVPGAILFAFGLLAVVSLGLNLFTGKSQYVWNFSREAYSWILSILVGNIVGCCLVAYAVATPELQATAHGIIDTRIAAGPLRCGLLAIGCGFIMTTAVRGASKGNWWVLLFGVPAFIICGFPHCIADAFYIAMTLTDISVLGELGISNIALFYLAAVIGNFIGCNLYRVALPGEPFPYSNKIESKRVGA